MPEEARHLIRRMQANDPAAFEFFAATWYPRICSWVAARTSRDRVMDYAQGVWIHITEDGCRRLLSWDGLYDDSGGNPDNFAGYLKTITTNKVTDLHRADNRPWLDFGDPPDVIDEEGADADLLETVEGEQIKAAFRDCFTELPRKDRRMLIMKWSDRPDKDIAAFFQMSANNVRQRRYQMLKKLKECLGHKLPARFSND